MKSIRVYMKHDITVGALLGEKNRRVALKKGTIGNVIEMDSISVCVLFLPSAVLSRDVPTTLWIHNKDVELVTP